MENTKSLLDEVLAQYEKTDQPTDETSSEMKQSELALWNYLCGDGDIRHLYDYYDLINQGN
jgi:hypothetical protein